MSEFKRRLYDVLQDFEIESGHDINVHLSSLVEFIGDRLENEGESSCVWARIAGNSANGRELIYWPKLNLNPQTLFELTPKLRKELEDYCTLELGTPDYFRYLRCIEWLLLQHGDLCDKARQRIREMES